MHEDKILYIRHGADFSFEECSWFLDRGFDDVMQKVGDGRVIKALRIDGQKLLVEVVSGKDRLRVTVRDTEGEGLNAGLLSSVRSHIVYWLDMERELSAFYVLLRKDRRLSYMADAYRGLRLIGIVDLFESLVWSIIGQQINLKFAFMLKRRLVERYGESVEREGRLFHFFPEPGVLAAVSADELKAMQFSSAKASYIIGLAKLFAEGKLSRAILLALPDRESRLRALLEVRGIGVWTANYCLMKCLRDPSGIPHGDTGLLTALEKHGVIKDRAEVNKIERFFDGFKGWESYVVFYLWRSLSRREGE